MDLLELITANWDLTWDAEPTVGTDKTGKLGHFFIEGFYNEEFKKYQDKEIRLLEIGIYKGASLALWSKYFTKGEIIGIDITDQRVEKYCNLDRVSCAIADAYNPTIAKIICGHDDGSRIEDGSFDIIIDDGPHTVDTLQKCIEYYLSSLKKGGVMVLEDVQDTSWFPLLIEKVPEDFEYECIDLRKVNQRYDDLLFVLRN